MPERTPGRAVEVLADLCVRAACDARTVRNPHDPEVPAYWRKCVEQALSDNGLVILEKGDVLTAEEAQALTASPRANESIARSALNKLRRLSGGQHGE